MGTSRHNPHFRLFPINNARTGYQPFAFPTIYVEPHRVTSSGQGIGDSGAIKIRYFVVDAPDPARVAGPFNQNIRIPDSTLFEIELSQLELGNLRIDLTPLSFFKPDGTEVDFEDAEEGDTFEYTIQGSNNATSRVTYFPDAFYYDLSTVAIGVENLPRNKRYLFVWEAIYFRRLETVSGGFKCLSPDPGRSVEILEVAHPGEVHEFMFRGTPSLYFDYEGFEFSSDPTLAFYRPFADTLQDIFDEQEFLDGLNHIRTIPAQLLPYLSFLIGWDLPNFPGSNDDLRRQILRRAVNLQKLKGTRRVIRELFEMFGFTVDIINLWANLKGDRLLGTDIIVFTPYADPYAAVDPSWCLRPSHKKP